VLIIIVKNIDYTMFYSTFAFFLLFLFITTSVHIKFIYYCVHDVGQVSQVFTRKYLNFMLKYFSNKSIGIIII